MKVGAGSCCAGQRTAVAVTDGNERIYSGEGEGVSGVGVGVALDSAENFTCFF